MRLNHSMATEQAPQGWPDTVPTLIDTERGVTLRAHTEADLPGIVEQSRDPETVRWTSVPTPYAEQDATEFVFGVIATGVDTGQLMSWAVEAEIEGVRRYCGTIDLRFEVPGRMEFGLAAAPVARGRGIMAAGCRLALDWAFGPGAARTVSWLAFVGNWPSRWIAESLGFRFAGTLRGYGGQRGELVDSWIGVLRAEDPRGGVPRMPTLDLAERGLRLRPFRESDLPRIVEANSDPQTQHWMPQLPYPYEMPAAEQFLDWCREGESQQDHWTWCVTEAGSDRCLGAVTLFRLRDDAAHGELGYWTHPDARGRRLTAAAVDAVATYALGPDGPHQALTIRCARGNAGSQRVALAAGFTETGWLTGAERFRDGSRDDLLVFSRYAG